ncbi:MAG TPA: hypothetical protein VGD88_11140 [Opitutaceae bacterium]
MLPISPLSQSAYAIFTQTLCEGLVPAWHDESNLPVTYPTEFEAQREIAKDLMEQLRQFLDGSRNFDDAITTEDFILPVQVWPDGRISTEDGRIFGKHS